MGCDYYISECLQIKYKNEKGEIIEDRLNENLERGYFPEDLYPSDYDSDEDYMTNDIKMSKCYNKYIEKFKKPKKILFENNLWVKDSYQKNYETYLKDKFGNIELISLIKIQDAYLR